MSEENTLTEFTKSSGSVFADLGLIVVRFHFSLKMHKVELSNY